MMKNKKHYAPVKISCVKFSAQDVVTASVPDPWNDDIYDNAGWSEE